MIHQDKSTATASIDKDLSRTSLPSARAVASTDVNRWYDLSSLKQAARETLPRPVYDLIAGGTGSEATIEENRAAYARLKLANRVLADIGERTTSTSLLGHELTIPAVITPMAYQRLVHPEGELATARATARLGTIMTLSSMSNTPVEDVVAVADGSVWMRLYVFRIREATRALIERAYAAGCRALMLTVDVPVFGNRLRDLRNNFHLSPNLASQNMAAVDVSRRSGPDDGSALGRFASEQLDPSLGWTDVSWIRSVCELPLLLKGIMRPDDAIRAIEHGVDGIIVSNHGGRQLDVQPATIDVLPSIARAVAGRLPILVDGGVRSGADILKAVARGAKAVMLGRPILWGLAVGGEKGVF